LKAAALATTLALLAPLQLGCAWVSLTSGGEKVRVLERSQAADCQRLGHTTSQTTDRALIFARLDRTVNEELRSLARNEAAHMGGDAVVPVDMAKEGRQSFDVYRCSSH
jgi:hypothetical protein